jgi:hypothetical protein
MTLPRMAIPGGGGQAQGHGRGQGQGRVRSHCRFAPPFIRCIQDSRRDAAPLFLKRHRGRTLGKGQGQHGGRRRRGQTALEPDILRRAGRQKPGKTRGGGHPQPQNPVGAVGVCWAMGWRKRSRRAELGMFEPALEVAVLQAIGRSDTMRLEITESPFGSLTGKFQYYVGGRLARLQTHRMTAARSCVAQRRRVCGGAREGTSRPDLHCRARSSSSSGKSLVDDSNRRKQPTSANSSQGRAAVARVNRYYITRAAAAVRPGTSCSHSSAATSCGLRVPSRAGRSATLALCGSPRPARADESARRKPSAGMASTSRIAAGSARFSKRVREAFASLRKLRVHASSALALVWCAVSVCARNGCSVQPHDRTRPALPRALY